MKRIFTLACVLFLNVFAFAQTDEGSTKDLVKLSLEELMNIRVVTSTGESQKASEAPSIMVVITKEQIEQRGYEQLDDALRDIPGIDLIHTTQAYNYRTFRGMFGDENKRILIMMDGIVVNNIIGSVDVGTQSFFSLHNVERIEIIWGPGSALYGANAYSGVINIINKKGADINGLHYQKGYGSFNTAFDKATIGIKRSNFDIVLSGTLYNSDGPVFTKMHPNYTNSYIRDSWSLNNSIEHEVKKFKTKAGFNGFETTFGLGTLGASPTTLYGLPSIYQNTGNTGIICADIGKEKPSAYNAYYRLTYLQNQFTPNEKLKLFTQVQYIESGVSGKSYGYAATPTLASKTYLTHYSNRILGEIRANYTLSDHHHICGGITLSNDNLEKAYREINPDSYMDTIGSIIVTNMHATFKERKYIIQSNTGVYAQYILNTHILHKTNFIAGARYDLNNIYEETFNPRMGIINQPHEKLSIKLLFGTAFRAPSAFELYSKIPGRIPNPDLKPEKVNTYDLGVTYTPTLSMLIRVSVFQNNLMDIIVQDVTIAPGTSQNQNKGTAITKGVELKIEYLTSKIISAFMNLTYLDALSNDDIKELAMPNVARYKGNAGVTFHISDLLNVSIIENGVGPRSVYTSNPLGEVKGYLLTNIIVSTQKLFNNRVSASFNLQNVFNQTWLDPGIKPVSGIFGTVHEQPGINGLFKVCVTIK